VRASFLEIYQDQIMDLLLDASAHAPEKLQLRERDGIFQVEGLTVEVVQSVQQLNDVLQARRRRPPPPSAERVADSFPAPPERREARATARPARP
jgi:hypothetical protein